MSILSDDLQSLEVNRNMFCCNCHRYTNNVVNLTRVEVFFYCFYYDKRKYLGGT